MLDFFPDPYMYIKMMKERETLTQKEYGQRLANSKKRKKKRNGRRK